MATQNLSALFPDSRYTYTSGGALNPFTTLLVYNTSISTPGNGGQCCLWTVPANATWAKFEVWGGGGGGAGGCCCQSQVWGGGSGSYARKTIQVKPGDSYTICAGSSTTCSTTCCGFYGCVSWAQLNSGTYGLNVCAQGGGTGISNCYTGYCQCNWTSCICGAYCGADFGICGHQAGGNQSSTCGFQSYAFVAEPTYVSQGVRTTFDYCQILNGSSWAGCATFPGGGGGGGGSAGGSCCYGGWGQGGLVVITYK